MSENLTNEYYSLIFKRLNLLREEATVFHYTYRCRTTEMVYIICMNLVFRLLTKKELIKRDETKFKEYNQDKTRLENK